MHGLRDGSECWKLEVKLLNTQKGVVSVHSVYSVVEIKGS